MNLRVELLGKLDPFYMFLELVRTLGEGNVFLLDAGQDDTNPRYKMSILGVCPVMEVSVKDGVVSITALPGLDDYLEGQLNHLGYGRMPMPGAQAYESVIPSKARFFATNDPMKLLEDLRAAIRTLDADESVVPFSKGLLGYIGYDAVHYLERLPKTTVDDRNLPDVRLQWHAATIHVSDSMVSVYESEFLQGVLRGDTYTVLKRDLQRTLTRLQAGSFHLRPAWLQELEELDLHQVMPFDEDVEQAAYMDTVEKAKEYIRAGDIFQVVLSKRIRMKKVIHHYAAYERLRKVNPSPYMFVAEYPDMRLFGASPEVQFRSVDGLAEMKPIAGTSRGRGKTPEEDLALQNRLLSDEKERSEHVMLVDLCRNDLGRVCTVGSVEVSDFMEVEPYSHLFHLVSTVHGRLRTDVSVFHALLATFPAGTLSGAPKIRAMEIIDELEHHRRGPYGGLLGMIDFSGNANTAIVIRTVVEVNDEYFIQVGAGIVADSDPRSEWQECGHKAGAVFDVLTGKHLQKA